MTEQLQQPSRNEPLRATVIATAITRRDGPQVDSRKLDAAKLGEELNIVRLLRTASGTTRAQTADDSWVTATTRDGKRLLAGGYDRSLHAWDLSDLDSARS